MVLFDKSMTLNMKLHVYDNESLRSYGYDLGLKGLSKLKKDELTQKIADRLLDPEIMFYRSAILTEKEVAVVERGLLDPVVYNEALEANIINRLNEMDFIAVGRAEYVVTRDIAEVWKSIRDERFEAYRKRASWVWRCLHFADKMYGYAPLDIILKLVNVTKRMHFTTDELREIIDHFPSDIAWIYFIDGNHFMRVDFACEKEIFKRALCAQADKEYYIPTVMEVDELYETEALLSTLEYKNMQAFLVKEMAFNRTTAKELLTELWFKASEEDIHETMQWFYSKCNLKNESQVEKIVSLLNDLLNNTRTLLNRGNTPNELKEKSSFTPTRMPVIIPGSSHAARMLSEATPEIRKMGFDIDIDGNAASVPVMTFPNGPDGQAIVREKKVYPNDPCPCGSGKKYKRCCGRG